METWTLGSSREKSPNAKYNCTFIFLDNLFSKKKFSPLPLKSFDEQSHLETDKEREGKGDEEHTPEKCKRVHLVQLANNIQILKSSNSYLTTIIPREPKKEESTKAHVICVS